MNLIELDRALKQLRLGGMAAVLETRLRQAQSEPLAPIDLISCLVSDELARRGERLLERRKKQAQFRDAQKTLDNFDFNFNRKMKSQSGLRSRHRRLLKCAVESNFTIDNTCLERLSSGTSLERLTKPVVNVSSTN